MTPEKYKRVKEIFLAACEKPGDARTEFVTKSAAGDAEIQREVESLLSELGRDVQVMPSDPESPFGSMSAILSRAQIELGEEPAEGDEVAPVGGKNDVTHHLDDSSPTGSGSSGSGFIDSGRFMAGTVASGRYRIIELLGRGGMGEVYRADDLMLNQSIALKFLPAMFGGDEKWLERFHNEVRLARQVTHPNVCRVFDIGEFQGEQFISMEYVDGENLASLLRRIGRVPHDKAVQIARQLCAGLAAAHDRGVLHRDLKPANVMIDGRGSVRITDFGLAAPTDQLRTEALRAGTPAYMSPEQLAGRAVTVRSDIYSLGLLLYEMFTGKRPFKGETFRDYKKLHTTEDPTPPSEIVDDIDPIVERVILKCLQKDPKARPASAMAVAAALPGGNPLREILNAGETPSPEVVAAAGEAHVGLHMNRATLWLIGGLLSLLAVIFLAPRAFVVQKAIKDTPPAVLRYKAREILNRLGYESNPRDSAQGFSINQAYYVHVQHLDKELDRWGMLSRPRPGLVSFWYRESPELMTPWRPGMPIAENDPPSGRAGMVRVSLDPLGHLIGLEMEPTDLGAPASTADVSLPEGNPVNTHETDWRSLLLRAADIDITNWKEVEPRGVPTVYADERAAWTGNLPGAPSEPLRIEAAAYRGRAVYFTLTGDWREEKYSDDKADVLSKGRVNLTVQTLIMLLLLVVGSCLAFRHYRSGRGDRQGAARISLAFLILGIIAWCFRAHHVPDLILEFRMFTRGMGPVMYTVALVWIFYMALEPYVRRIWPETVISWNRLLAGRWIDPIVGRDVLIGSVIGIVTTVFSTLELVTPQWLDAPAPMPPITSVTQMLEAATNVSTLFSGAIEAIYVGLLLLLFIVIIRMAVRSKLFIAIIFTAAYVAASAQWASFDYLNWIVQVITAILFLVLLIRYGLVAMIFCWLTRTLLLDFPVTYDLSAWYAPSAVAAILAVMIILAVSTYAAVGGRPLVSLRLPEA